MSEITRTDRVTCDGVAKNCANKLGRLVADARAINTYTASRLDEFACRQRGLATETTVRISSMAENAGIDHADLERPEEVQRNADDIELKIAELAVDRPIATVACEGSKVLSRCGAYLTEE